MQQFCVPEIFALSDTDILDKLLEFKKSGCVLSGS